MEGCGHLDQIEILELPEKVAGCEECLRAGSQWVHLRMCHSCGHIGCCDSSPSRHARAHAEQADHPLVRSAEPDESWSYCFLDDVAFVLKGS